MDGSCSCAARIRPIATTTASAGTVSPSTRTPLRRRCRRRAARRPRRCRRAASRPPRSPCPQSVGELLRMHLRNRAWSPIGRGLERPGRPTPRSAASSAPPELRPAGHRRWRRPRTSAAEKSVSTPRESASSWCSSKEARVSAPTASRHSTEREEATRLAGGAGAMPTLTTSSTLLQPLRGR